MSDQRDKDEKAAKLLALIEKYRAMERYWMGVAAGQHEVLMYAQMMRNTATAQRKEYAQKIKMKSREYAKLMGGFPPPPPPDLVTRKTEIMRNFEADENRSWMDRTAELDEEYREISDEDR